MATWKAVVEQGIKLAVEELPKLGWLLPGTYYAEEIHNLIQQKEGAKYYCNKTNPLTNKLLRVTLPKGFLTLQSSNVFYALTKAEKMAAIGVNDRYRFVVEHSGAPIGNGKITFASKKHMKRLTSHLCKIFKDYDDKITFRLKDGYFFIGDYNYGIECDVQPLFYDPQTLPKEDQYVFTIPLNRLGYLFDKCDIKLLKNQDTGNLSLLFTREDGWTVSTEDMAVPTDIVLTKSSNVTKDLNKLKIK